MYKIMHKPSNTNVSIGYQEEVEDSDGNFYSAYYYILDGVKCPDTYTSYEAADDHLICACYSGDYDITDYEIVRV